MNTCHVSRSISTSQAWAFIFQTNKEMHLQYISKLNQLLVNVDVKKGWMQLLQVY